MNFIITKEGACTAMILCIKEIHLTVLLDI